ncbi:esterase/lipase family protein [Streptomyces sp. NPDC001502]|uniref:esterase/lipase family protein n=1 Tax=Streptomyces sp. NPDC001502 TaxID=3364578 RepID=UPI0036C47B6D
MSELERDGRMDLPYGVVLRSSDVGGRVGEVRRWAGAGAPVRAAEPVAFAEQLVTDSVPADSARLLGTVIQEAGMRPVLTLPLSELTAPAHPGGHDRADAAAPGVVLQVPAPGEDEGQVVLEVDATGVVRWVVSDTAAGGGGTDRAGAVQTFRVSMEQFGLPGGAQDRGLAGFGVRKVLHVLRFPIQRVAGRVAEFAVGRWEERFRPYGLRLTGPESFLTPTAGETVSADRLAELADRPFLVFVHGTFSRCHSGFHGIAADRQLLQDLHERYRDRVLVFDHPTVHLEPADNARWLLEHLPADRPLTLDLVAHSRGGLVARQLGSEALARDARRPAPCVRTLIHVATPNAGTVLADRQRLGRLLDAFTNLLCLLPDEMVSSTLEVVLEVVKHCAAGALGGLDGLAAMDPASSALGELNEAAVPAAGTVRAITSDFGPADGAGLAIRALNRLTDHLFGTGNDLVVPTEGVHRAGAYVVSDPLVIPSGSGVAHTDFFRDAEVRIRLAQWLPGS